MAGPAPAICRGMHRRTNITDETILLGDQPLCPQSHGLRSHDFAERPVFRVHLEPVVRKALASGDLDLWTMNLDGSAKKQLTKSYGYDGGAVFSRDGKKLVWRSHYPRTPEDTATYQSLLAQNLTKWDVFHFHFGRTLIPPHNFDLPLYRALGKKLVYHFHGCDVRNCAHMLATHAHSTCTECDPPFCIPKRQKRVLAEAAHHAHAQIVSTPDLLESVRNALDAGQRLLISYYSASTDQTAERTITPRRLFASEGHWYVDAWCEVADGTMIGNCPPEPHDLRIIRANVETRSGPALGAIFAALPQDVPQGARETDALSNGARLASLAIETRRLYSDLRHRSEFDLLTDIYNRFSLHKRLEILIQEAGQNSSNFGLIYIDLDKFKPINDTFGHHVGDMYLQAVAGRMNDQLLGGDMLARLGGDEFAALVALQRGRSDLERIVKRLSGCFEAPFVIEGHVIQGLASIGYALYPEDGASKDALLNAADASMYAIKNSRHQVEKTPV